MRKCTILLLSLGLFSAFFSEDSLAAVEADCGPLIFSAESWAAGGTNSQVAVQIAFNKSRGEAGHFSLTDGHLDAYDPVLFPEVEALLNRGQRGIFAPIPKFIMDGFQFDNILDDHARYRRFPTERKDAIYLIMLENGEVFVILRSFDDTVLPVEDLRCYVDQFIDPGFYMTGVMPEVNGTTIISFVVKIVSVN